MLIRTVNAARAWFAQGGPAKGLPLDLEGRHGFQLLERTVQPTLPGPLPDDFALWSARPTKPLPSTTYMRTPDIEESQSQLKTRGRLKTLSS